MNQRNKMLFGEHVRNLRENRGLTINQLAESLDCSVTHIYHIENGKSYISEHFGGVLASALGTREDLYILSEFEKTVFYMRQVCTQNPWQAILMLAEYLLDKYYCQDYLASLKQNGGLDENMQLAEALRNMVNHLKKGQDK